MQEQQNNNNLGSNVTLACWLLGSEVWMYGEGREGRIISKEKGKRKLSKREKGKKK